MTEHEIIRRMMAGEPVPRLMLAGYVASALPWIGVFCALVWCVAVIFGGN